MNRKNCFSNFKIVAGFAEDVDLTEASPATTAREFVKDLNHACTWVRQIAIEGLTELGVLAINPLLTALSDQDKVVRDNAAGILKEIGLEHLTPEQLVMCFNNETLNQKALNYLVGKGVEVQRVLFNGLQNPNPRIHTTCLAAIVRFNLSGELRTDCLRPVLTYLLTTEQVEKHPNVCLNIQSLLQKLR